MSNPYISLPHERAHEATNYMTYDLFSNNNKHSLMLFCNLLPTNRPIFLGNKLKIIFLHNLIKTTSLVSNNKHKI